MEDQSVEIYGSMGQQECIGNEQRATEFSNPPAVGKKIQVQIPGNIAHLVTLHVILQLKQKKLT